VVEQELTKLRQKTLESVLDTAVGRCMLNLDTHSRGGRLWSDASFAGNAPPRKYRGSSQGGQKRAIYMRSISKFFMLGAVVVLSFTGSKAITNVHAAIDDGCECNQQHACPLCPRGSTPVPCGLTSCPWEWECFGLYWLPVRCESGFVSTTVIFDATEACCKYRKGLCLNEYLGICGFDEWQEPFCPNHDQTIPELIPCP
jgi:hypothetical protein